MNAVAKANDLELGAKVRATGDPAIDNAVCIAFQLGWDMSCLYRQARVNRGDDDSFRVREEDGRKVYPKLPSQGDFGGRRRTERRIAAVSAGLHRLSSALERSGFEAPSIDAVRAASAGTHRDDLKRAIYRLHTETLILLQAADPRLGSAFNVGRGLRAIGAAAETAEVKERFGHWRIVGLRDELHDLVSALPPHAGNSVAMSLLWWRRTLEPTFKGLQEGDTPRLAKRLNRQAELWRALLSGEKRGTDMLEPGDYTTAAERLLRRIGLLLAGAVRSSWLPIAIVVTLLVAVLVLAVGVGGVEGTLTALAGIAAAFGISWRGTGATARALASQLQGPLWGSEIDHAIAIAITDRRVWKAYVRLVGDTDQTARGAQ